MVNITIVLTRATVYDFDKKAKESIMGYKESVKKKNRGMIF